MSERPIYNKALLALQAAHDACFNANRDVLGMSHGPFSGVNEIFGIVDSLERENRASAANAKCLARSIQELMDRYPQERCYDSKLIHG